LVDSFQLPEGEPLLQAQLLVVPTLLASVNPNQ
jgi:hypothetical protein